MVQFMEVAKIVHKTLPGGGGVGRGMGKGSLQYEIYPLCMT